MSEGPSTIVRDVGPTTGKASVRDHSVLVDRPPSKGGEDRGPMGGEYLVVGLAGCFLSNLLAAIRARGANVSDIEVRARSTVTGTPSRISAFTLEVTADYDDEDAMRRLITIAERGCIASNTLKAGSEVRVLLEGHRSPSP